MTQVTLWVDYFFKNTEGEAPPTAMSIYLKKTKNNSRPLTFD